MSRYDNVVDHIGGIVEAPSDLASIQDQLQAVAELPSLSPELLDLARQMAAARLRKRKYFPAGLFRESAWDMLLELFIAGAEGRSTCIKDLIAVSGEPSTNAMRRIDRLQSLDLIRRVPVPDDQRRVNVHLTTRGLQAMIALVEA